MGNKQLSADEENPKLHNDLSELCSLLFIRIKWVIGDGQWDATNVKSIQIDKEVFLWAPLITIYSYRSRFIALTYFIIIHRAL